MALDPRAPQINAAHRFGRRTVITGASTLLLCAGAVVGVPAYMRTQDLDAGQTAAVCAPVYSAIQDEAFKAVPDDSAAFVADRIREYHLVAGYPGNQSACNEDGRATDRRTAYRVATIEERTSATQQQNIGFFLGLVGVVALTAPYIRSRPKQ